MAALSASLHDSVPIPRTRLIGREAERATARALLLNDVAPLLTLIGPGGVGKTRLALAIAQDVSSQFVNGVAWVDLAPLADPALVPMIVARALGITPTPGAPLSEEIIDSLRSRQQLLLLDNCEHVLAECAALVARVLAACPAVQVLATSRAPLRVQGEHEQLTEPLPLPAEDAPADGEALASNDAIRLFVEHARAVDPGLREDAATLRDIADICRRVDGLPLAIELAASRTRIWPPSLLRARLEQRLPLLTGGRRDAPTRQQTVRDTIGWSYDLLAADEQALFQRLCVFAGGFTLEAAQAIASGSPRDGVAPVLERLVEQNLIRRMEARGEPRFTILETIREFGLEQLAASGEEEDARDRHAAYFLALVERLDANVFEHLPEAAPVLARLQAEHPNLRTALARFEATSAAEPFVRLAGALHAFWIHEGHFQEGQRWGEQAIALGESASLPARVWAQVGLVGMLLNQRIEPERSLALLDEAMTLAHMSGDALAIGLATEWRGSLAAGMGHLELAEARLTESRAAFAALPQEPWVQRNLTVIDARFGWIAFVRGDLVAAESISLCALERMRTLEREHDADYLYASDALTTLGHVARARGDHVAALAHFQAALRKEDEAHDAFGVFRTLISLASTLVALGRWAEAARLFGAAEAICERLGLPFDAYVWADTQEKWGGGMWLWADDAVQPAVRGETAPPRAMDLLGLPHPALVSQWTAGRSLSAAAAVAEALAVDPLKSTQLSAAPTPIARPNLYGLSPREHEVLGLLCERLTDPEIAERLFISRRTASTHVANLFAKLGVSSRREAAALAAREGLV